jgi:PKHD-type hydroxylase
MYNEHLKSVGEFPRVFSPEECQRIINLPLASVDAGVQAENDNAGHVDYQFRRTRERPVPPDQEYLWIYQRLRRVVAEANQKAYHFRLDDFMTVTVLEYNPKGFFDWHLDLGTGIFAARKLSLVTFLTPPEEYEGGDLRFMDGGPPLRLPPGATVIFPSYLMHKVEPVTRGNRFTLVSWVHGPSFS